jgi:hypothetical protein
MEKRMPRKKQQEEHGLRLRLSGFRSSRRAWLTMQGQVSREALEASELWSLLQLLERMSVEPVIGFALSVENADDADEVSRWVEALDRADRHRSL